MSANSRPPIPRDAGIASIGLNFPPLAMPVEELARLRGQDPAKYTVGLGCQEMALCTPEYGVVELAVEAARRALERWGGDPADVGMIAVGTETAMDMSRPLSAWVAERLDLRGAVRSYEVKHACYGGTLALRQAVEWKLSGASQGRAALVLAADVALYAEGDPGEPTQGAGAVAMVVDEPSIARVDPVSYPWSEPAFDFWRPVGEAYPRVDGAFSLDCYKRAAENCFKALVNGGSAEEVLERAAAVCFHVPFPKMVKKAVVQVGRSFGWDEERIDRFFADKVEPSMQWNRRCGNAYTASLWISVAEALRGLPRDERVLAFSYGSGFGAELLLLEAGPEAAAGAWASDVETDLAARHRVDAARYGSLRS
ncbi:MAG: hydroxymethylglutaryl-CoA synthase family protein [Acidobacteria bacterium]|nr:MAG: hydroxymethylglutaryl-CoA synthase family protein [Acidobacteriota bacterium]